MQRTGRRNRWMLLGAVLALAPVAMLVLLDDRPGADEAASLPVSSVAARSVPLPERAEPTEAEPLELPAPTGTDSSRPRFETVTLDAPPAEERRRPGTTLLVIDPDGAAVVHARVEVWRTLDALDAALGGPLLVQHTDPAGRAAFDLPSRDAVVVVDHEDLGSCGVWTTGRLARASRRSSVALLTLRPYASLQGLVLQSDDRPAAGATLQFERAPTGGTPGRLPPGMLTDADGSFHTRLDAGSAQFVVASLGELASHLETVSAAAGSAIQLTLRFPGRWSVSGRLTDADGQGIADGTITAWLEYEPVGAENGVRIETRSESGGFYHLDLPREGIYAVVGSHADHPSSPQAEVIVNDSFPRDQQSLVLPPTGRIEGAVLRDDGSAFVGVTVFARPAHVYDGPSWRRPSAWNLYGEAQGDTGEDGRFVLEPLNPTHEYIVYCKPIERRPELKLLVKGVRAGTLNLLLVASDENLRRGFLDMLVLSDATGLPLSEFQPTLLIRLDGKLMDTDQPAVRSEDGRFRIEGLAPGFEYRLRVDAPGHGAVEEPWFKAHRRGHHLTLRLPPSGSFEVLLLGSDGRPLERALLQARRLTEDFDVDPRFAVRTDDTGRVTLSDLAPGSYALSANHRDQRASVTATLRGGDATAITLRLE